MQDVILESEPRPTVYKGLPEMAAAGLHAKAFRLFRRHVSPGSTVLDLGSGPGGWAQRLHDASYRVTACDVVEANSFEFPYYQVDLNRDFAAQFAGQQFDAISIVEVIEHLENPRHVFRQIKLLLNPGGFVLLSTPNASGLYSRIRFFFTGQMAMFTDSPYAIGNEHITPLTAWQLECVFHENGFAVLERMFHDAPFFPPHSPGELAKIVAWAVFRPFMFGTVGGQCILYGVQSSSPGSRA